MEIFFFAYILPLIINTILWTLTRFMTNTRFKVADILLIIVSWIGTLMSLITIAEDYGNEEIRNPFQKKQ